MAEIQSQLVEYLTVNEGLLGDPTIGDPVVILTIRPEPLESFEVVNLAIPMSQAGRLLADLTSLLMPFVFVVAVLLATTVGCGTRVDVGSEKWGASSCERARTTVEVDLLHTRPPEVVSKADPPAAKMPEPQAPPPSPPKLVAPEMKPINFSNNTFVLNYRAGDVTYRSETHIHVCNPPKVQERITTHREVEAKPPRRPADDRCDRGQKEHEERVKRWREFPRGY